MDDLVAYTHICKHIDTDTYTDTYAHRQTNTHRSSQTQINTHRYTQTPTNWLLMSFLKSNILFLKKNLQCRV